MKIIGAHNTLTFLKPKGIISILGNYFAKCQNKNIQELYNSGVRLFDIRLRVTGDKVTICHGVATYKGNPKDYVDQIVALYKGSDPTFIRFVQEDTYGKTNTSDFVKLINSWNIKIPIQVVSSKKDWTVIIDDLPKYESYDCLWHKGESPKFPYRYAKANNEKNLKIMLNYNSNSIWWFDFI